MDLIERIKNNWEDYYEFKESIVFNKMKNKKKSYENFSY